MRKIIYILVIGSCLCFWLGNMFWVFYDNPNLYYKPLAVLLFSLLLLAKEASKRANSWIFGCIYFFYILSISNLIKEFWFNPIVSTINDYVFPLVALIVSIIKYKKHQANAKDV